VSVATEYPKLVPIFNSASIFVNAHIASQFQGRWQVSRPKTSHLWIGPIIQRQVLLPRPGMRNWLASESIKDVQEFRL
jgi:hypothetical protein